MRKFSIPPHTLELIKEVEPPFAHAKLWFVISLLCDLSWLYLQSYEFDYSATNVIMFLELVLYFFFLS